VLSIHSFFIPEESFKMRVDSLIRHCLEIAFIGSFVYVFVNFSNRLLKLTLIQSTILNNTPPYSIELPLRKQANDNNSEHNITQNVGEVFDSRVGQDLWTPQNGNSYKDPTIKDSDDTHLNNTDKDKTIRPTENNRQKDHKPYADNATQTVNKTRRTPPFSNSLTTFNQIVKIDVFCSNVDDVNITKRIGRGADKVAFLGKFRNTDVVVKTALRIDRQCIKVFESHLNDPLLVLTNVIENECRDSSMQQLLKEIVYHTVLQASPQFVTFHGFCLHKMPKSLINVAGKYYNESSDNCAMIVTEYGKHPSEDDLEALSWKQKLNIAKRFAPLLDSMNETVLGPISMFDFVPRHFVFVNDTIKMYDLGLFYHGQLPCGSRNDTGLKYFLRPDFVKGPDKCLYDIQCKK